VITLNKTGGKTIQLFIPFEFNGKKIESVTLSPLRLGHALRWNEGAWKTSVALLVELADVEEAVIRDLRYPDADRVMESFLTMLTPDIRDDIINGRIPTGPQAVAPVQPAATNGGAPPEQPLQGPGVPFPSVTDEGFDLSEEP